MKLTVYFYSEGLQALLAEGILVFAEICMTNIQSTHLAHYKDNTCHTMVKMWVNANLTQICQNFIPYILLKGRVSDTYFPTLHNLFNFS